MMWYEIGMWYAGIALTLFFVGTVLDFVFDLRVGFCMEQIGFYMMALVGVAWGALALVGAVVAIGTVVF